MPLIFIVGFVFGTVGKAKKRFLLLTVYLYSKMHFS